MFSGNLCTEGRKSEIVLNALYFKSVKPFEANYDIYKYKYQHKKHRLYGCSIGSYSPVGFCIKMLETDFIVHKYKNTYIWIS